MSRNLQSIGSGSATIEEFIELVKWEAQSIEGIQIPDMKLADIEKVKREFDQLCKKWETISESEILKLVFK